MAGTHREGLRISSKIPVPTAKKRTKTKAAAEPSRIPVANWNQSGPVYTKANRTAADGSTPMGETRRGAGKEPALAKPPPRHTAKKKPRQDSNKHTSPGAAHAVAAAAVTLGLESMVLGPVSRPARKGKAAAAAAAAGTDTSDDATVQLETKLWRPVAPTTPPPAPARSWRDKYKNQLWWGTGPDTSPPPGHDPMEPRAPRPRTAEERARLSAAYGQCTAEQLGAALRTLGNYIYRSWEKLPQGAPQPCRDAYDEVLAARESLTRLTAINADTEPARQQAVQALAAFNHKNLYG